MNFLLISKNKILIIVLTVFLSGINIRLIYLCYLDKEIITIVFYLLLYEYECLRMLYFNCIFLPRSYRVNDKKLEQDPSLVRRIIQEDYIIDVESTNCRNTVRGKQSPIGESLGGSVMRAFV